MKKNIVFGLMLVALLVPCTVRAEQDIAVSAAVLPFESFSGDQKTSLGRDVAVKLLQQLSANPLIVTPAVDDLKAVIEREEAAAPSEERLREIARQLNVNFVLFGSVTSVQDEVSIDTQVFYNFPGDNYFKTFAAGPELERVIEELARKIEQELLDKASLVPTAQRPKVKIRRKYPAPAGEPGAADYEKVVNRELAEEQELEDAEAQQAKSAGSKELDELVEDTPPKQAVREKKKREKTEGSDAKDENRSLKLDQPVNISSDSLEYSNKDNTAIFRGNVVARQGNMSMFADQMEATYAGKSGEKNEKGGIKELAATGNVKIIQGDRIATGQKIVFYGDEQKIVATGNPRVWQGDNVIVGNKITVYLKQDRSVVEGTPKDRVSATIQPKEKKGKKK
jgi:lipopolysaccharide export system protein LptA